MLLARSGEQREANGEWERSIRLQQWGYQSCYEWWGVATDYSDHLVRLSSFTHGKTYTTFTFPKQSLLETIEPQKIIYHIPLGRMVYGNQYEAQTIQSSKSAKVN